MMVAAEFMATRQESRALNKARSEHHRLLEVASLGVSEPLWDLAPKSAIPLVKALMDDDRVISVSVLDAEGKEFLVERNASRLSADLLSEKRAITKNGALIGTVQVEFSLDRDRAEVRQRLFETLGATGVQLVVCVLFLIVLITSRVLIRLQRIEGQAAMLARKQLDTPFDWPATDEIGVLGQCLESTRLALAGLFRELESKNGELGHLNASLERLVAERTSQIRTILDHVQAGFLLIDRSATVQDGFTKSCRYLLAREELCNVPAASALALKGNEADHFLFAVDQVFDDLLPEQVALRELPRRVTIGSMTLALDGRTVRGADNKVEQILFTIVDVTELQRSELDNQTNRALIRILQNAAAFGEFVSESRKRLDVCYAALRIGNERPVRFELHTLKGLAAAFGLTQVADTIHGVEDAPLIQHQDIGRVEQSFKKFLAAHQSILGVSLAGDVAASYTIKRDEIDLFRKQLFRLSTRDELLDSVSAWLDDVEKVTAERLIGPIGEYAANLGRNQGKDLDFSLRGGDVRIAAKRFKNLFQNLGHLVRNAIDHGTERRGHRGPKPSVATVAVAILATPSDLEITVSDDGKGIDREAVLVNAVEIGLLKASDGARLTDDEVARLIFADRLSTSEYTTPTSGRGMGMGAIKQAVDDLGGVIKLATARGRGTTVTITVPLNGSSLPVGKSVLG